MTRHSTRSSSTRCPPAVYDAGSWRGVYLSNRAKAAWLPETNSSGRKRNGPQPTISVSCLNGSVAARRSGTITGCGCTFERKCASSGNGFFRRQTSVRSSGVSIASTRGLIVSLTASRFSQRCSEATQSRASTGVPSWNSRPSRRRHRPALAVVVDGVALDHLRLRIERLVAAVQRFVDHQREVAGDGGGGPHRIEAGQVGLRHEDQGLRGGADRGAGERQGSRGCGGCDEGTAFHGRLLPGRFLASWFSAVCAPEATEWRLLLPSSWPAKHAPAKAGGWHPRLPCSKDAEARPSVATRRVDGRCH